MTVQPASRNRAAITWDCALNASVSLSPHATSVRVGVATGSVTVGVIGGSARLEYTAVGAAVNLASRLCELACDGEILVDRQTVQLAGAEAQERAPISFKGFDEPVAHFGV